MLIGLLISYISIVCVCVCVHHIENSICTYKHQVVKMHTRNVCYTLEVPTVNLYTPNYKNTRAIDTKSKDVEVHMSVTWVLIFANQSQILWRSLNSVPAQARASDLYALYKREELLRCLYPWGLGMLHVCRFITAHIITWQWFIIMNLKLQGNKQ